MAFTILVPWVLSHWLVANARRRYEAQVRRMGARIRVAFPGEVSAWGGAGQLSDPAFVDAAMKRVAASDYEVLPPADPVPEPPPDPTRKAAPLWIAIPMSLVFAVTAGIAVGAAVYWLQAPIWVNVPFGVASQPQYFAPGGGGDLGSDQARSKDAIAEKIAAGAGIVVGLASLLTTARGLSRRMRFMKPTLAALTAGYFLLGLPALVTGPTW